MATFIKVFNDLKSKVQFLFKKLKINQSQLAKPTGRKLAIKIEDALALELFRHSQGIVTKKSLYEIFHPHCSYKTLVVSLIRSVKFASTFLTLLLQINRDGSHWLKHIDATNIPVCRFKNAHAHKTMKELACFGHSSQGTFYGLKMHLISDFKRKLLAIKFTGASVDDREVVMELSQDLTGIFIADAGYTSQKLAQAFYQENQRILLAQPRKNMKKLITFMQNELYKTRMIIELNFRNLKMFYGLITSLPRSVDGYLANYIHAILAYILA